MLKVAFCERTREVLSRQKVHGLKKQKKKRQHFTGTSLKLRFRAPSTLENRRKYLHDWSRLNSRKPFSFPNLLYSASHFPFNLISNQEHTHNRIYSNSETLRDSVLDIPESNSSNRCPDHDRIGRQSSMPLSIHLKFYGDSTTRAQRAGGRTRQRTAKRKYRNKDHYLLLHAISYPAQSFE
ncbi:hypothetical protein CEXT_734911 [Caerostris extrusa]|uniref:Uncharacterized protein n=1 Tax=Caerostris extrusa TaxID=172846 RepID=A0AAV4Y9U2_CAEEX|nr:hypothetical protein CEXT_734911 [Caerostris extrusa]